MPLSRVVILAVLITAIGVAGYVSTGKRGDVTGDEASIVTVRVPDAFSARAQLGRKAYEANCAACHGQHAAGRNEIAPPLVHVIYEPGHHGDESFQRAVARGVPAHHWRFGDMPPVEGLTRRDVAEIVAYVRELQRANGIR